MNQSSRVRIELPTSWLFSVDLPVRITDINYGHHVGNDTIVALIHDARFRWLHQYGWTELDVDGVGLIMADVAVRFKAEAGFGDTIRVQLAVSESTVVGFGLVYLLTRVTDGAEIARATTGLVFFDYGKRSLARMPPGFLAKTGVATT